MLRIILNEEATMTRKASSQTGAMIGVLGLLWCTGCEGVREVDAGGAADGGLPGAPCGDNADCASGICLSAGGRGGVCTARCSGAADCVAGWTCTPLDGSEPLCRCTASTEVCNLEDDDCDGRVDEGSAEELDCGAGLCVAGRCECPAERQCTAGVECTDIRSDAAHCGECGNACPAEAQCVDGACVCPTDLALCGSTCANLDRDPLHCGACDNACRVNAACRSGTCECRSHVPTLCAGGCTNLDDDPRHCGACGNACTVGTCVEGACVTVDQIDSYSDHTCARLSDGTVRCWGDNAWGQLGDGTTMDRAVPTRVPGLPSVAQVATGRAVTCALVTDGTVQCWGYGEGGQLGDGMMRNRRTPAPVTGIATAVQVSVGTDHACARLADGSVWCWGNGIATPEVSLASASPAADVSAGGGHVCAVLTDGTARCWGSNGDGQLGTGSRSTLPSSSPRTVSGLSNATRIAAAGLSSCAALDDGTARCWGSNLYGQLGDGSASDQWSPSRVADLSTVADIVPAGTHGCALLDDTTVRCWGDNRYGEVGDGMTYRRSTPTAVLDLTGVAAVAVGGGHTCALLHDGTVRCWGANNAGQLGDGTFSAMRLSHAPVRW